MLTFIGMISLLAFTFTFAAFFASIAFAIEQETVVDHASPSPGQSANRNRS